MPPMPQDPKNQPNQRLGKELAWIWWLVLLGLILWNLIAFWPTAQQSASIPYSVFLEQVRAGNVTQVKLVGNVISGDFAHPIVWPAENAQAQPGSTLTATAPVTGMGTSTPATAPTYTKFQTVFPDAVGDPDLLPLLEAHQVVVDVAVPPSPWFTTLLLEGLPLLLLVGFFVWMGRRGMAGQTGMFNFARSKARRYTSDQPEITFNDVAGQDEAKRDLQEVVDFLRNPMKYHRLGARIPRGVLLVGPPGTGKTLISRAVAGEAGVPFFSISASEFVEMFVGVGASRVRDLFEQAKQAAPAIVFIDELDAVGRRRGAGVGTVNDEREQTLNQLLVEMDGFDEHHEIVVLAATNRPDVLDPALLRPGRFDRRVTLGLPDFNGRLGILRIHVRPLRLDPDVDLETLAGATTGFSGADLANLCNEAALIAARHNHEQVTMSDFEEAQDKIMLGDVRPLLLADEDRRVIAYHEGGHTVVAWFTPQADPVHKVTIIPRGKALGVTEQVPGRDQYNYSRDYLLARLAVMLGGRSAEELVIGEITTGAENDLVQATRLARRMVTRWGMSELGLVAFEADEEQPFLGYEMARGRDYSEATAARIDEAVRKLLEDRYQVVRRLLEAHRPQLDRLAQALLEHETVDEALLKEVLGPRPGPDAAQAEGQAQPEAAKLNR